MITGPMIKWAQYGIGKIERGERNSGCLTDPEDKIVSRPQKDIMVLKTISLAR
jgi:hypothetical protein